MKSLLFLIPLCTLLIAIQNSYGSNIFNAIEEGNLSQVKKCVKKWKQKYFAKNEIGEPINIPRNKNGKTPLFFAYKKNKTDIILHLLEAYPEEIIWQEYRIINNLIYKNKNSQLQEALPTITNQNKRLSKIFKAIATNNLKELKTLTWLEKTKNKFIQITKTKFLSSLVSTKNNNPLLHQTNRFFGQTPLCFACEKNNTDIILYLLNNGAQETVNIGVSKDDDKSIGSPLYFACKHNNTPVIKALLPHCDYASIQPFEKYFSLGWGNWTQHKMATTCLLYYPCLYKNYEIIKLLLLRGSHINYWTDEKEAKVIYDMLQENNFKLFNLQMQNVLKKPMEHRGIINTIIKKYTLQFFIHIIKNYRFDTYFKEKPYKEVKTMLKRAIQLDNQEYLYLLKTYGVHTLFPTDTKKINLLIETATYTQPEAMQYLLNNGLKKFINKSNGETTPLLNALLKNNIKTVALLYKNGAKIANKGVMIKALEEICNPTRHSILTNSWYPAYKPSLYKASVMLTHGFDIRTIDQNEMSSEKTKIFISKLKTHLHAKDLKEKIKLISQEFQNNKEKENDNNEKVEKTLINFLCHVYTYMFFTNFLLNRKIEHTSSTLILSGLEEKPANKSEKTMLELCSFFLDGLRSYEELYPNIDKMIVDIRNKTKRGERKLQAKRFYDIKISCSKL